MKELFSSESLPSDSIFVGCSSHEDRCLGIAQKSKTWRPMQSVVFHYDDHNPRREKNHQVLCDTILSTSKVIEVPFTEGDAVSSFHEERETLSSVITEARNRQVVLDISVFTKRHLFMVLRWLDDHDCWDRLWVVYTEPVEYEIEGHMPLSFGISSVSQVPGFPASPDPSRPLHLAMFLGYEGDRAFATYEILQARKTTLIIPHPAFKQSWTGRTQAMNRDLLAVVGTSALVEADALDPQSSYYVLEKVFGGATERSDFCRAVSPLGTKPQAFGTYMYLRRATDPPSVMYTSSLRHNHRFYSRGVGPSWLIHRPN